MKQLTCRELGGPCDSTITGNSAKEMQDNFWRHMQNQHPEEASGMESDKEMTNDSIKRAWEAAPNM